MDSLELLEALRVAGRPGRSSHQHTLRLGARDTRPFGTPVKRSINSARLGLRGDPLMLKEVGEDLTPISE
jgi:hypothetical protein